MIVGIIAISTNYAIGKDGKLPWRYRSDLRFFKETTIGNAVVMGARTWRSIGKPLPNRLNIVLSRSGDIDAPHGVIKLGSVDAVVELAAYLECDVFIIGGATTYAEFANVIEKWMVTLIPEEIAGADTFMPRDFLDRFENNETILLEDGLVVEVFRR